jgi:FHS family L-fucose permease-like MFS transporter
VLACFALGGVIAALVATLAHGPTAMYALIFVGLFTSIMFPTIFALAIRGLGPLTEEGSGWLIWAIAGGGLVVVNGKVADLFGLHWAFLLTAMCELYVLFYALWGSRPTGALPPERLTE